MNDNSDLPGPPFDVVSADVAAIALTLLYELVVSSRRIATSLEEIGNEQWQQNRA